MPTFSQSNFPTPASWEEFESIVLDALTLKWRTADLQKNGRRGQAQAGVDIYGTDEFFKKVGVQCKKYDLGLNESVIKKEIRAAESFSPKIHSFYIATTAPLDAVIQKKVRLISKNRVDAGEFFVGIFFWDDIIQELVKDEQILKKHYPQYFNPLPPAMAGQKLYSFLDLAFYGLNFGYFASLLFGEIGFMVQEDPKQMEVIVAKIDAASASVLKEKDSDKIKEATKEYLDYVMPYVMGYENRGFTWRYAHDIASRISKLIKIIDSRSDGRELLTFKIGEELGAWESYEGLHSNEHSSYDKSKREYIQKLIAKLIGVELPVALNKLFDDYEDLSDFKQMDIPTKIYISLRKYLIEKELLA